MPSTHIHVRIDNDLKMQAQQIFSDMGLDISTAINMFIRQVVRNRSFPFLPSADPFYGENNMTHLMRVKADADADAGNNMTTHDLIEE
jgi:DNA-damage-inducible protein J